MTVNHLSRAPLPEHPLRAWRLGQRVADQGANEKRRMTLRDAATAAGVPVATWAQWERWPEEGGRIPRDSGMAIVFRLTNGKITAQHFYRMAKAA